MVKWGRTVKIFLPVKMANVIRIPLWGWQKIFARQSQNTDVKVVLNLLFSHLSKWEIRYRRKVLLFLLFFLIGFKKNALEKYVGINRKFGTGLRIRKRTVFADVRTCIHFWLCYLNCRQKMDDQSCKKESNFILCISSSVIYLFIIICYFRFPALGSELKVFRHFISTMKFRQS